MRRRFSDRTITTALLLFMLVVALVVLAMSVSLIHYDAAKSILLAMIDSVLGRVLFTILAVIVIGLCCKVVFFRDTEHTATERLRMRSNETGSIVVSEQAIVQMVNIVLMNYPQITEAGVQLGEEEDKLQINLRTVVDSESLVPQMIEQLQARIIAYIKEHAGLEIGSVSVFVDTSKHAAGHASNPE